MQFLMFMGIGMFIAPITCGILGYTAFWKTRKDYRRFSNNEMWDRTRYYIAACIFIQLASSCAIVYGHPFIGTLGFTSSLILSLIYGTPLAEDWLHSKKLVRR